MTGPVSPQVRHDGDTPAAGGVPKRTAPPADGADEASSHRQTQHKPVTISVASSNAAGMPSSSNQPGLRTISAGAGRGAARLVGKAMMMQVVPPAAFVSGGAIDLEAP